MNGTLHYEKGPYAFFEGSRAIWDKDLQLSNSIAGYKITAIEDEYVDLVSVSNSLRLPVGAQMRQEKTGWLVVSNIQVASLDTGGRSFATGFSADVTTRGGGGRGGKKGGGGPGGFGGQGGGRGGGGGGGGRKGGGGGMGQAGVGATGIQPGTAAALSATLSAASGTDAVQPGGFNNTGLPGAAANPAMQQPNAIELPNVPDASAALQQMIQRALEDRIAAAMQAAQDDNAP